MMMGFHLLALELDATGAKHLVSSPAVSHYYYIELLLFLSIMNNGIFFVIFEPYPTV